MKRFLLSFIPQKIPNKVVIRFFEFLRKAQHLFPLRKKAGVGHNDSRLFAREHSAHCFIEDQNNWTDCAYGRTTISFAGCEIIALYNALCALEGEKPSFTELVHAFERDGMVLGGRFGTSPAALRDYLAARGYRTEMTVREQDFPVLAGQSDCLIVSYYNDGNDILAKVHTVCVTKTKEGYTVHNAHGNGTLASTVPDFSKLLLSLNGGRTKPIALIGIFKAKERE